MPNATISDGEERTHAGGGGGGGGGRGGGGGGGGGQLKKQGADDLECIEIARC